MTTHFTALIRVTAATGLLLGACTAAYAETGEGARRFHIDCQNGYKYGEASRRNRPRLEVLPISWLD